ncbi:unnamed protein product, partial [Meganyctiphanes norvegica]
MGVGRNRQAVAATAVGVGGLVTSLAMGFTSPALPKMANDPDFHMTDDQASWIGSVMPAMALLGSLASGPLVDNLGRRITLILLMVPFAISWSCIAMASSVVGVIVGRMIGGFCVGIQAVAGSVFLPEILSLQNRNLNAIPAFLGPLGLLVTFVLGSALSWRSLSWMGAVMCVPAILLLLQLPETPYYLTFTGRRDDSVSALNYLRESSSETEKEQNELDISINSSKSGKDKNKVTISDCFVSPNLWPVTVAMGLMVAQQTTGINAVIFYASNIFKMAGAGVDGDKASMLLGVCNMLATLLGITLLGMYNRKILIKWSSQGVLVSLLTLSMYFIAREKGGYWTTLSESVSFIPLVGLLTYIFAFAVGWGPIPWVFLGEGLPSSVRGLATSVVVAVNWGFAFVITKTFSWFIDSLGIHYTFMIYAVLTAICQMFLESSMPETFGKSVMEMDQLYQDEATKKEK